LEESVARAGRSRSPRLPSTRGSSG
jgi:hypothetical protein